MSSKDSKGMYGFDATGLERAAKAAKVLDDSPNSKEAYELARKREESIGLEHKTKLKYIFA
jgi:hypothetical protein